MNSSSQLNVLRGTMLETLETSQEKLKFCVVMSLSKCLDSVGAADPGLVAFGAYGGIAGLPTMRFLAEDAHRLTGLELKSACRWYVWRKSSSYWSLHVDGWCLILDNLHGQRREWPAHFSEHMKKWSMISLTSTDRVIRLCAWKMQRYTVQCAEVAKCLWGKSCFLIRMYYVWIAEKKVAQHWIHGGEISSGDLERSTIEFWKLVCVSTMCKIGTRSRYMS